MAIKNAIEKGNVKELDALLNQEAVRVLIENGADTQSESFENHSVQQLTQDTGNASLIEQLTT